MQHIYMYTVKNTEHNEIKVGDSSLLLHENCVHVHTSEEHHRNCNSAVSKVVFWTGDENMFGCTALTPTRTPHPPLTVDLVDLRVLWQYFVGQFLCRRQHLSVMHRDQILDELLQLISVHLEKSLWDGQAQFDLLWLPYPVQRERHDVGAVENVFVAAAARYCCDFAAVEADAHTAEQLWLRWRGGFSYRAA